MSVTAGATWEGTGGTVAPSSGGVLRRNQMPGFSSLWPEDPNHFSLQAPSHGAAEGWQQGLASSSSSTLPLLRPRVLFRTAGLRSDAGDEGR